MTEPLVPRTDHELRILDAVVDFLEERGVRWWLDQGSALGAVRDACFLPWDHDVDVSVLEADLAPHRHALAREMHRAGFRVKELGYAVHVDSPWRQPASMVDISLYQEEGGQARRSLRRPPTGRRPGAVLRRLARAPVSLTQRGLDWLARRLVDRSGSWHDRVHAAGVRVLAVRGRLMVPADLVVQTSYFDAVERVQVNGRELPVPHDPERYLELKYGPDWRTPRRDWVFWEEDGAVQPST